MLEKNEVNRLFKSANRRYARLQYEKPGKNDTPRVLRLSAESRDPDNYILVIHTAADPTTISPSVNSKRSMALRSRPLFG